MLKFPVAAEPSHLNLILTIKCSSLWLQRAQHHPSNGASALKLEMSSYLNYAIFCETNSNPLRCLPLDR